MNGNPNATGVHYIIRVRVELTACATCRRYSSYTQVGMSLSLVY